MIPKIKICGITTLADAQLAIELGADLLGFNFYKPSVRYIEPRAAGEIIAQLPGHIIKAGVFVNSGVEGVAEVLRDCPLDVAQLHSDQSNDECQAVRQLGVQVFKALRIRQKADIGLAGQYKVDAVVLDAWHEDLYGGSGNRFDWNWLVKGADQNIYLAGGINPDNIAEAVLAGTYGIDLCSGVEKEGGIKDENKMRVLFERFKRACAKK